MSDRWSLVTYAVDGHAATRVGVLLDDGTVRSAPSLEPAGDVLAVLRLEDADARVRELDPHAGEIVAAPRLSAPLSWPGKVICAGANYDAHVRELGLEPKGGPVFFFLKPPSTTVIGPGAPVSIPADEAARVDYEGELAVVIGRAGSRIAVGDAMDHVAGYTIVNDVSARGLLARPDPLVPAMGFDWIASKGRDTFCPTGPGVTPAWQVPDPHALELEVTVNGEVRQSASTGEMAVRIDELIAQASELMTLEPGDVLATGTPQGVAMASGRFLRPGDVVEVAIEGLGRLRNPVVAA